MSELKRCPFCGGEVWFKIAELDAFRNVYSFLCKDCDMEIIYPYSNEEEAINAWNTRKPIEKVLQRLEEERKEGIEYYNNSNDDYFDGTADGVEIAIDIIKEGLK